MTNPMLPPAFLRLPVAHRGLHDTRTQRPENALSALRAAVGAGYGVEIDLMPSWFEDGFYCVAGHTVIPMARTDLLPLGQIDFHGVALHVPASPEVLLGLIYGPSWRIPDPFYRLPPDKRALRHRRRFRADQKSRHDLL